MDYNNSYHDIQAKHNNIDIEKTLVYFICQYMGYKNTLSRKSGTHLEQLNLNIFSNNLKLLAIFRVYLEILTMIRKLEKIVLHIEA